MTALQQTVMPGLAQEARPVRRTSGPVCHDCGRPESRTRPLRRYLLGCWCVACSVRLLLLPEER